MRPWLIGLAGFLVTLLIIVTLPSAALADGMAFGASGGTAEVQAAAQRAVLWQRDGTWEIHIQPIFQREQGAAAWVVPFPVRPTVLQGNADFFDQLELATAPVFVSFCNNIICCPGPCDGGTPPASMGLVEMFVTTWESGTVGSLDYVVLSAADGDNLVDWLQAEGFEVQAEAITLIDELAAEGSFFFASRLSPDADPEKPIAPVRFILPDMAVPSYPLRMTTLGIRPGERLELTLWIIAPQSQRLVPDNYTYDRPFYGYSLSDINQYERRLTDFFSGRLNSKLALVFARPFADTEVVENRLCPFRDSGWIDVGRFFEIGCIDITKYGIDLPETWSDELLEIDLNNYWVTRYQGKPVGEALIEDLKFKIESIDQIDHMFVYYTGDCWECPERDGGSGNNSDGGDCGCGSKGGSDAATLLYALLLMAVRRLSRTGGQTP